MLQTVNLNTKLFPSRMRDRTLLLILSRCNIRITCPCNVHPLTTHFYYSKIGVYRGKHYFLIFALKHRLWVLVRTASLGRFSRVPTIYVLSKIMKIVKIFQLKIVIYTAIKNRCMLHRHVFVMLSDRSP